MAVHPNVL